MRTAAAVLALLLLQAALPVSAHEHAAAPSPQNNTLWAHPDPVDHRNHHRMDTNEEAGSRGSPGTDQQGTSWRWTLTLQPRLNETLVLDPNGTIHAEAYIGGSGIGSVSVTTMLHHGDVLVAEGDARPLDFTPSSLPVVEQELEQEYALVEWGLDVEQDRLQPDEELVWSIVATGHFTGIFLGMEPANGQSRLVLPIVEAIPQKRTEEPEEEIVTPAPAALLLLLPLTLVVHRLRRRQNQGTGHE